MLFGACKKTDSRGASPDLHHRSDGDCIALVSFFLLLRVLSDSSMSGRELTSYCVLYKFKAAYDALDAGMKDP
jgi:hypothetical protein